MRLRPTSDASGACRGHEPIHPPRTRIPLAHAFGQQQSGSRPLLDSSSAPSNARLRLVPTSRRSSRSAADLMAGPLFRAVGPRSSWHGIAKTRLRLHNMMRRAPSSRRPSPKAAVHPRSGASRSVTDTAVDPKSRRDGLAKAQPAVSAAWTSPPRQSRRDADGRWHRSEVVAQARQRPSGHDRRLASMRGTARHEHLYRTHSPFFPVLLPFLSHPVCVDLGSR